MPALCRNAGMKPNDLNLTHRATAPGTSWFISTIKNMMFFFFGAISPISLRWGKNPNFFHCHHTKWFRSIAFFQNPLIIIIACIWIAIQFQMTNPTLVRYIYTFYFLVQFHFKLVSSLLAILIRPATEMIPSND